MYLGTDSILVISNTLALPHEAALSYLYVNEKGSVTNIALFLIKKPIQEMCSWEIQQCSRNQLIEIAIKGLVCIIMYRKVELLAKEKKPRIFQPRKWFQ